MTRGSSRVSSQRALLCCSNGKGEPWGGWQARSVHHVTCLAVVAASHSADVAPTTHTRCAADMDVTLQRLTCDVIGIVGFSKDYEATDLSTEPPVLKALQHLLEAVQVPRRLGLPAAAVFWEGRGGGACCPGCVWTTLNPRGGGGACCPGCVWTTLAPVCQLVVPAGRKGPVAAQQCLQPPPRHLCLASGALHPPPPRRRATTPSTDGSSGASPTGSSTTGASAWMSTRRPWPDMCGRSTSRHTRWGGT